VLLYKALPRLLDREALVLGKERNARMLLFLAVVASLSSASAFVSVGGGLQSAAERTRSPSIDLHMNRIGSNRMGSAGFRDATLSGARGGRQGSLRPGLEVFENDESRFWLNPFPLKPYNAERVTVGRQVDPNIFVFEQEHGFANVSVNIRMTVVRLSNGGLWVHAPVAPTAECVAMVQSLGEVLYVVLPTTVRYFARVVYFHQYVVSETALK